MNVSDGELRALMHLTEDDAKKMLGSGKHYQHYYFTELYRAVARAGLAIPLEQLKFCFTRDPDHRAWYE